MLKCTLRLITIKAFSSLIHSKTHILQSSKRLWEGIKAFSHGIFSEVWQEYIIPKYFTTLITVKKLLSTICFLMCQARSFLCKTFEPLIKSIKYFLMFNKSHYEDKSLVAVFIFERFLPKVCSLMRDKSSSLTKTLIKLLTFEWLLPSVNH